MSTARSRRSGYDDRVARARHIGAALTVALALGGACRGPGVISIGTTIVSPGMTIYLSPTGSDDGCCATQDAPWKTFGKALKYVKPGATIVLEDGTYEASTSGLLNVVCDATVPPSSLSSPNAVLVPSGTANMPITVKALNQRQAFLAGDGSTPPLTIDACQYWSFDGLHVESKDFMAADFNTALNTPDVGSVIVVGFTNANLLFENLLVLHPNRWLHSHLLRIGDKSRDVAVTDSEFYDFHHNAIEAWRTDSLRLLRNYTNSRGTPDLPPPAWQSEAPNTGDYGIFLEETSHSVVANNVIEGINDGMALVGRYYAATVAPGVSGQIDNNLLLGNVVYQPLNIGIRIDSRCWKSDGTTPEVPCTDTFHMINTTLVQDDVVIGGDAGILSAGAVNTAIDEVSVINAANGVSLGSEPQNAGFASSSTTTNSLVANFQAVAFDAVGETTYSFDHCATSGGYNPGTEDYVPGDFVTNPLPAPSPLGPCLVYLSSTSPLKTAGVGASGVPAAVGANVVYEYNNDGTLSSMPLWTSAGFRCGTQVTTKDDGDGGAPVVINPDCANVAAQHLNVASMGCASPY
jgi:hypothetical protein